MKKTIFAAILAGCLVLSLAGCSNGGNGTSQSAAAPAAASSSFAVSSAPEAVSIATPVDSAVEPTEENNVQGTVVSASMNGLSILTPDGKELFFPTVDAEVTTANGLLEGNWVSVEYRGTIQGTDTTGVHVDRVLDNAPNLKEVSEGIVMEDCDETMYVTHAVHVRDSNSTSAKILDTLPKGTQVHCTGKGIHGWRRVDYNGGVGYIFGDYLSDQKSAQQLAEQSTASDPLTAVNDNVATSVRLRMHVNPSIDSPVAGVADTGTVLHRVGTFGSGWSKVEYNGSYAYCDTEYLTVSTAAPANDATPTGEVNRAEANTTYYTTVALKLHKTYSMDSTVVAVVPKGTALYTKNLMDNHWSEVEYDGQTLYCVTEYLAKQQPETTTNAVRDGDFNTLNDTVYTISLLHLRAEPSMGGQLVATAPISEPLSRTGISIDGNWCRVTYENQTLYCATQYVTTTKPASPMNAGTAEMTEVDQILVASVNLRLHDADALEATVVAVVPQNTQLERVGILNNGWSVVMYNGERLFCASEYLK